MLIAVACLLTLAVLVFILAVRPSDIPEPEAASPFAHLDERKFAIYENLRDLQFEYRVGKMSDGDYQSAKRQLQQELAGVLSQIDQVKGAKPGEAVARPVKVAKKANTCPHCGAVMPTPMKFCGECGKPMEAA